MADEIKLKAPTVEQQVNVVINGEEKLKSFASTLENIASNKNLQKYWKDQKQLIEDVSDAYGNFTKNASKNNALELMKTTNALKALSDVDISSLIPDFKNFSQALENAKKVAGSLDSAFSVNSFKDAFSSFETLRAYGIDLENFFKHFELDINVTNLQESLRLAQQETRRVRRELSETQEELSSKKIELASFIEGSGLTEQIEKLRYLEDELRYVREQASEEFRTFLKGNDFSGWDLDENGAFERYFNEIRDESLTAKEAIANFKSEYSYLLQEKFNESSGLFNLQQVQAFENKLETVLSRVEEISRQMNDIVENGVMTKAMQNLSVDNSISQSQRDLFTNVLKDEEALSSIAGVLKKIIDESVTLQGVNNKTFDEEQFNRLLILFEKIESSLSSMKAVFADVGDGEELSPLLKMIDNVQSSIKELSTSVKGIGLNMNIDVGSDSEAEAKIQSKISNALQAYQRLFDHIKMSGAGGSMINNNFFEFDINQYDTMMAKLQAYRKFIENMRKEAKSQFNGKDVLFQGTDKSYWTSASSAMGQVTKAFNEMNASTDTSPLENLFGGKTDLTEVVTQLNLIVDKLGEISTTASEFKNTFANGFNVSASVEEIEKLTSRVKELEDELSKIKMPTSASPVETNISSGNSNIENELKLLQDKKKILSSLQEEYDEEEISEMSQIKSYQEILRLVTKIRDLKLDNTMAKGKASGARQINDSELAKQYEDEASAIRKEINTIEDAIPLLIAFEDLTKKTISSFTTNDELNNFAIELYQCLVNLRGELGLINSEDFSKVSAEINTLKESVIKIPDKKKVEIELEYKSVTPNGELVYRGIAGKDGNYLNVSNDDGAVWWTSQKDLSQTRYTRNGTGSEFSGNLKAKNLFEFVSASTNWQKATNLGDGSDELSIKITDLYNKIETLKSKKEELIKTNQIESQEYKNISIELGSLESQYDAISKSKSNMYGTHMPNDWVKIAKKNGYDGLAIHNIDDDTNGLATSYAVWAKEQIENVKIVADTEEDFIRIHNEFLESASSTPIKDTFQGDTKVSAESSTSAVKEEAKAMEQVAESAEKASKGKDKFAKANKKVKESADSSSKAVSEEASEFNKIISKLDGYNTKLAKFEVKPADGNRFPVYQENITNLSQKIERLQELSTKDINLIDTNDVKEAKALQKEIDELIFKMSNMSAGEKGFDPLSLDKAVQKMNGELEKASGMSKKAKLEIKALISELESGNPTRATKEILHDFYKIIRAEQEAGRYGKAFMDIFKDKVIYGAAANLAGMIGIYDIINVGRQAVDIVIDLNTQITELAKVSEDSMSQIYDDFNSYAEIAKDIGGTISDTISATSDWSRNGYSIPDSKELAKVALLYKNVGDGIDIDTANESLISTLRGFEMEAKDALDIINIFNEVSNNEAISSAGIGEALQRSAASFNAANTSLQESVALISATNSVVQNPERVGNMWKVVSMRIRSASSELEQAGEDTDGLVETTADLQKMIKAMTGYDILEADGETFKSIYDIVLNISKVWHELSDLEQSSLLQALAGKQQSNALAAALSNADILEKSYKEAMNAEGSALEEQAKYQESVQYSIDRTKASLEELANDFLSSDFLKGLIDSGDKLINILDWIIDKFGVLGTLTAVGGGILGANGIG